MTNPAHSGPPYLNVRRKAKRLTKRLGGGLGFIVVALVALAAFGNSFVRGFAVGALVSIVVPMAAWTIAVWRKAKAGSRHALEPPVIPTGPWDYDMAAHELDGPRISFSEFAGSVLVLSFWIPWHGPSMRQMPALQRLREGTSDLDIHFACVTQDSDAAVREYLDEQKRKPSLPLYVLDGGLPKQFRSQTMPTTFVIDRAGTIVLRQVGPAAWDHESVVAFLRRLAEDPGLKQPQ